MKTYKPHIVWLLDGGHGKTVREKMPLWADSYAWIFRGGENGETKHGTKFARWLCPDVCYGSDVIGVVFFDDLYE